MNSIAKLSTLAVLAVGSTSLAFATPITPGGATVTASNAITVTPNAVLDSISGTLTALTFTGNYTEYVIQDGSNPYGANDLTFVFTISNNPGMHNGIEHMSDGDGASDNFALFPSVNVGYLAANGEDGTDVPVSVDETIYGTVEFNFTGSDAIAPGTGTEYLVIQTPATNFALGNLSVIDSSTDTVTGLVPAAATPEPSSLMLLGTGLIGSATTLLRRRRNSLI